MNPNDSQQTVIAPTPQPSGRSFLSLLPWLLVFIMAIALTISIMLWKPWQPNIPANSRTVEVTGSSTIKAEPDEFVFYPTYNFKNKDKAKAIEELTIKSNEIVAAIKKLGVEDKNIKSDSSGYTNTYYYDDSDGTSNYTLSLTVTTADKDLAQKVQDYLVTTNPEGAVSPQATFSTQKEKQLQDKARDEATQDARTKADKSAKNLGFSVGAVKTVVDGDGFNQSGGCGPNGLCMGAAQAADVKTTSLAVQPGQNELTYTVKVTYFIK